MGDYRVGGGIHDSAVTVATTATLAVPSRRSRTSVLIQNLDAANPIYIGGSTVTSSTGTKVAAGQNIPVNDCLGEIYAIATGASVNTRILEVY